MTAKMLVLKDQAAERKREQVNAETEKTLREFDNNGGDHKESRWQSMFIRHLVRPMQIKDQFSKEFEGKAFHLTLENLKQSPQGRAGLACFGAIECEHIFGQGLASSIISEVMVDASQILKRSGSETARRQSSQANMQFLETINTAENHDARSCVEYVIHWYAGGSQALELLDALAFRVVDQKHFPLSRLLVLGLRVCHGIS